MKRFGFKRLALLLLIIQLFSVTCGVSVGAFEKDTAPASASEGQSPLCLGTNITNRDDIKISSRIFELLFNKSKSKTEELLLIPGGDVFGIKIKEAHVTVSSAKESSALRRGDKILSVNGCDINDAADVNEALKNCTGGAVNIDIIR